MASLYPQTIDEHNWYYEYPHYIEIIHEVYKGSFWVRTDHIKIPKWKLKKSLKRLEGLMPPSKEEKKVIIGWIWEGSKAWIDKFKWAKPYGNATPYIDYPHIFIAPADKRLTWLKSKKVKITIEEIT